MKLELTNFENVTEGKALYVEEQANRMLDFFMKSRDLLREEAHKTLQWLFAIVVGGAGYIVSLLNPTPLAPVRWWLVGPVAIAVAVAAFAAVRLFRRALYVSEVLPAGNEPKKLATDERMAYPEQWIRLAEAALLQERIELASAHNNRAGSAINAARWVVAMLPFIVLLLAVAGYLTWA